MSVDHCTVCGKEAPYAPVGWSFRDSPEPPYLAWCPDCGEMMRREIAKLESAIQRVRRQASDN